MYIYLIIEISFLSFSTAGGGGGGGELRLSVRPEIALGLFELFRDSYVAF